MPNKLAMKGPTLPNGQYPNSMANHEVRIDIYTTTDDCKVVTLIVDGVSIAKVSSPAEQPLYIDTDRNLTVRLRNIPF